MEMLTSVVYPVFQVHAPIWQENPAADWFKSFCQKPALVYPHHAQLRLTAKAPGKKDSSLCRWMPATDRKCLGDGFRPAKTVWINRKASKWLMPARAKQYADICHGYRRADMLTIG